MIGRKLGVEPIRITLENAVPEDASGRYCLHLGEQPAHAVANEHHVLRFGNVLRMDFMIWLWFCCRKKVFGFAGEFARSGPVRASLPR
jgi:hypothetical protein